MLKVHLYVNKVLIDLEMWPNYLKSCLYCLKSYFPLLCLIHLLVAFKIFGLNSIFFECGQKRRPCTFVQSLGRPIVRLTSQFFLSTKKNCPVSETGQKILVSLFIRGWTKKIRDWPNFFFRSLRLHNFVLVDQKNEKLTGL